MKTSYYIYLVTIYRNDNVYYYVGQHSWNGPEGQLDPDYVGSCSYQHYKTWLKKYKYTITLLEVCTKDNISEREEFWINEYLKLFGSFLKTIPGHSHLDKFKLGTCLNGTLRGTEQLMSPEAREKALEKQRNRHFNPVWLQTPEARHKALNTLKERGYIGGSPFKDNESLKASLDKANKVAREVKYNKSKKVRLEDGFVGNSGDISQYLGISKSTASNCVKFAHERNGYYAPRLKMFFEPVYGV